MAKTLSFAVMHMTIAFSVVYLLTGDVLAGGAVALIEPLCNTVAFYFHEKLWRGGPRGDGSTHGVTAACTTPHLPRPDRSLEDCVASARPTAPSTALEPE